MRTLRVEATGGPVCPLSLFRLRQIAELPRIQALPPGAGPDGVKGFEVEVDDAPAAARLCRYLDLESRLTGVRLVVLDELWSGED